MADVALAVATIGIIIILGVFLKLLSEKKGYPLTLFLLLLGLIIGPWLGWFKPSENLTSVSSFITLALIIVLFDAGMGIKIRRLSRNFARPLTLGIISVLLTVSIVAITFKFLLSLSWLHAILFGSFLASTDLTIIAPIFKNIKVKPAIAEYIELESTFNSILAAVFVVILINLINTGTKLSFSLEILSASIQTLLYNIFVGAGLGILFGYLILKFIQRLTLSEMPHIMILGALFFSYAISELVGASGIATALAIGIVFGNSKNQIPSIIKSFGGEMELILVTFVYVILGAIINFSVLKATILPASALIILVYFARFIAVKYTNKDSPKLSNFYILSSPRGITCAVLTLSYATLFPNPEVIIGLVFSVILVSSFFLFWLPNSIPSRI